MATLNVPGTYPTIAAAVAAAAANDIIVVAAGYAGNEAVTVGVNNLTFNAPAGVSGIVLTAGAGVARINLGDASPIRLNGNAANNILTGNNGANVIGDGGGGNDQMSGGGGDDTITTTGGTDTANGGAGTGDLLIVDYSAATTAITGGGSSYTDGGARSVSFSLVERLRVLGGSGDDNFSDGSGNDTLDGGAGNDTLTANYGGTDTLIGGSGNDRFNIYSGAGTVDGGADTDTVVSSDLGAFTFSSVEVLDLQNSSVYASTAQLNAFGSIISTGSASNSQYQLYLRGAGGTIDFSTKVAGAHSVYVYSSDVTSGYSITGTVNGDTLSGSSFNDTLDGSAGDDVIDSSSGGTDTLIGGSGNDRFNFYSGAGTVDGGADTDTVVSSDLGAFIFSNVEVLDLQNSSVFATTAQLNAFGSFISTSSASNSQYQLYLRGDGGTIDFSTKVTGAHSVYVYNSDVTSDYSIIGSVNSDNLSGSSFNDTLDGGGGNDTLDGGSGNDLLDGGDGNDNITVTDGIDTVRGGVGTDTIYVGGSAGGTVDGGADADKVSAYGDLGTVSFSNVEVLDLQNYGFVYATTAQLSAFSSIIDTGSASNSRHQFALRGAGGTIDFSTKVAGAHGVYVYDSGVTSGYTVTGTSNADDLNGSGYDDMLTGGGGNDTMNGGGGNDTLDGGDGNDTMDGGPGNDTLDGGGGNDTITVADGIDTVRGGIGTDTFYVSGSAGGTVDGGADSDKVFAYGDLGTVSFSNVEVLDLQNYNYVYATAAQLNAFGSIVSTGSASNSQQSFYLRGDSGTIDFSTRVIGARSVYVNDAGVTTGYTVIGTGNGDVINGSSYDDVLDGGVGNDTLSGGGGRDLLHGGVGNDALNGNYASTTATYFDAAGGVRVSLATTAAQNTINAGSDTLNGITGLIGSAFDDTFTGGVYGDTLDGGTGNDALNGGAGDDVLIGGAGNDSIVGGADNDTASYAGASAGVTVNLAVTAQQNTTGAGLDTISQVENLLGTGFADSLTGSTAANTLTGDGGDDVLAGGAGADTLFGDEGIDTAHYVASAQAVTVNLRTNANTGGDAQSDLLYGIENVTGSALGDVLTGDTGANLLTGLGGNDTLSGGDGADVLDGGDGNDILDGGANDDVASYATASNGVAVDLSIVGVGQNTVGAGTDRISNVENLVGSGFGDTLTGDAGANRLDGGAGDDTLAGGAGSDMLVGGTGTDTAVIGYAWRQTNVVQTANGYAITAGGETDTLSGIEQVRFTNGTFAIGEILNDAPIAVDDSDASLVEAGAGASGAQQTAGNLLANDTDADTPLGDILRLIGIRTGAEADATSTTAVNGSTILVGTYGTLTVETDGSFSYVLDNGDADTQALAGGATGVERFTYTVTDAKGLTDTGELSLQVTGTNTAPVVAGLSAQTDEDTTYAGSVVATDADSSGLTYALVDAAPEGVTFNADGTFTVAPLAADQALAPGQSRSVTFAYTASDGVAVSAPASVIIAINGVNDMPTPTGDHGYVTRSSSIVLPLSLLLANDGDPEGDTLSIVSVGNAAGGTVTLDGSRAIFTAAGTSTPANGGFDYVVSDGVASTTGRVSLDLLTATSTANTLTAPTLAGEVSYLDGLAGNDILTGGAGLDTLLGGGGADQLVGQDGADTLYGGANDDRLEGGDGADVMFGGAGNDTYVVDAASDVVREDTVAGVNDGGVDTVLSSTSYVLGTFLENLTLTETGDLNGTGNTLNNIITGSSGANVLAGGGGSDRLIGGAGDDTYVVANPGVVVIEDADAGLDTVQSSVTFTLANNLENLVLTGTGQISGTGNTLANVISGTSGNNSLDGKAGADTLIGGAGNDIYFVDNSNDVVLELAGEGADTVNAAISYTLSDNVERLTLTGGSNTTGTGNALANILIGNTGVNQLAGLGGKDIITGGAGGDLFIYRMLSDSLVSSSGRDTITDFSQSDRDRVDLRLLDANTALANDQAFKFIGTSAFAVGTAGQLRYAYSGTDTILSGDVNGDGVADFSIQFTGQIAFSQADFLL